MFYIVKKFGKQNVISASVKSIFEAITIANEMSGRVTIVKANCSSEALKVAFKKIKK